MSQLDRIQAWNTIAGTPQEFDGEGVYRYYNLVSEEYDEVTRAYMELLFKGNTDPEKKEMALELVDLIVVATGAIHTLGFSASTLLKFINDRNFDKFLPASIMEDGTAWQEELDNTSAHYNLKPGELNYRQQGDLIVLLRKDGKILKPKRYRDKHENKE